jgi:hypothetical protein
MSAWCEGVWVLSLRGRGLAGRGLTKCFRFRLAAKPGSWFRTPWPIETFINLNPFSNTTVVTLAPLQYKEIWLKSYIVRPAPT